MQADECCSIALCRRPPVLTYLEARLCQFHWERVCEATNEAEAAAAEPAATTNARPDQDGAKEIEMSKKTCKKTTPTKAVKEPKAAKPKLEATKRLSALDAAAQVLSRTGKPMRCPELIAAMAEQKLWASPNGKTPEATLAAAMLREIKVKARESRFKKVDRGQFTFAG